MRYLKLQKDNAFLIQGSSVEAANQQRFTLMKSECAYFEIVRIETTHEIGHCSPLDKGEYRYGRRKQKEGSQTI